MRDPLELVGAPYCLNGSDPVRGFDCWTFVEYARREYFGLPTPCAGQLQALELIGGAAQRLASEFIAAAQALGCWQQVDSPGAAGDVVGMSIRRAGTLHHVGLALPEHGVLHAWAGVAHGRIGSVVLTPWERIGRIFHQLEVYRCRA